MATTLKQGGSLFQTSEEEKAKLQGQPNPNTPALTPQGNAAAGGSPDSAKMQGTPAQKTAALRTPATPPQQDYARATRMTPQTPQGPDAAAKAAAEKADRLKQMSSIDVQVQGMIEARMQQMQQQQFSQATLNEQALGKVKEEQQPAVRAALEAFRTAPDEATRQTALQQLQNATGNAALTPEQVSGYFQTGAEAFRESAAAVLPENVKLGQLPEFAEQYDVNQIAADLGVTPEAVADMTLEQLQQAVQDTEAQNFNKMQEVDAKLLTASGAERQALLAEKRRLTAMGVTGVEASIDRLQQSITAASSVRVAGEEKALQDILSDDALSDLIVNAAGDDKTLAAMKLRPETQGLAEWIELNKQNLADIGKLYRTTTREYMGVQEEAQKAIEGLGVSEDVFKAVMGDKPANFTAEQWATYQADMQANPVFQAASEDEWLKSNLTPENAALLKDMDKEDIKTLSAASQIAAENADIAQLLGIEGGSLLTDAQTADDVDRALKVKNALGDQNMLMSNPLFQKEWKAGNIDEAVAAQLAADPDIWVEIEAANTAREKWEKAAPDTADEVLSLLSGDGPKLTLDSINNALSNLKTLSLVGDPKAKELYDNMKKYFDGDGDGKFTDKDIPFIQKAIGALSGNLADIAKGNESFADFMEKIQSGVTNMDYHNNEGGMQEAADAIKDGLSITELNAMGPEALLALEKAVAANPSLDRVNSYNPFTGRMQTFSVKKVIADNKRAAALKVATQQGTESLNKFNEGLLTTMAPFTQAFGVSIDPATGAFKYKKMRPEKLDFTNFVASAGQISGISSRAAIEQKKFKKDSPQWKMYQKVIDGAKGMMADYKQAIADKMKLPLSQALGVQVQRISDNKNLHPSYGVIFNGKKYQAESEEELKAKIAKDYTIPYTPPKAAAPVGAPSGGSKPATQQQRN